MSSQRFQCVGIVAAGIETIRMVAKTTDPAPGNAGKHLLAYCLVHRNRFAVVGLHFTVARNQPGEAFADVRGVRISVEPAERPVAQTQRVGREIEPAKGVETQPSRRDAVLALPRSLAGYRTARQCGRSRQRR